MKKHPELMSVPELRHEILFNQLILDHNPKSFIAKVVLLGLAFELKKRTRVKPVKKGDGEDKMVDLEKCMDHARSIPYSRLMAFNPEFPSFPFYDLVKFGLNQLMLDRNIALE